MRRVDISEETYALLQKLAEPLTDTTDSVIHRLAKAALCGLESSTISQPPPPMRQQLEGNTHVDIRIGPAGGYEQKYALIPLNHASRQFFPGYKVPFTLGTDVGAVSTKVTSSSKGSLVGDPALGKYIMGGLRDWYKRHAEELRDGGILRITQREPLKRYRLDIVSS